MANITRSAKSANDWSKTEFLAYNISVQLQNAFDFFGKELGPIDHLDPNLLSSAGPTISSGLSKQTYRFLAYLNLASRGDDESVIDDLARSALQVTGFDDPGTIVCMRNEIPFNICGEDHKAVQTCLVHLNTMVLLVVHDHKTLSQSDPEPQVVAKAIAAFQHNNRKRIDLSLPRLDKMTIPCIIMVGTRPFFYKVPVTTQLSDCVAMGQYPPHSTVVSRCTLSTQQRSCEGMEVPDYRYIALQYYDAFRGLARACWTAFLDGCD